LGRKCIIAVFVEKAKYDLFQPRLPLEVIDRCSQHYRSASFNRKTEYPGANRRKGNAAQVVFISRAQSVQCSIFEFLVFSKNYFSGFTETLFSPRRPIYQELVPTVKSCVKPEERILVSQRLGNPSPFFHFYQRTDSLENFEFRTFDIWKETDLDKLFIDVLPDEATPSEPLYTISGEWPGELKVLKEFHDENLRHKVVVYRFK